MPVVADDEVVEDFDGDSGAGGLEFDSDLAVFSARLNAS